MITMGTHDLFPILVEFYYQWALSTLISYTPSEKNVNTNERKQNKTQKAKQLTKKIQF